MNSPDIQAAADKAAAAASGIVATLKKWMTNGVILFAVLFILENVGIGIAGFVYFKINKSEKLNLQKDLDQSQVRIQQQQSQLAVIRSEGKVIEYRVVTNTIAEQKAVREINTDESNFLSLSNDWRRALRERYNTGR